MTISFYGHSCFKITNQGGHLTIITDPFDAAIGLRPPRIAADIVTLSSHQKERSNIKAVSGEPFVVDGPGEYEVEEARINGISSFDKEKEEKRGIKNTIYSIEVDKIKICHLGAFNQPLLENGQLEKVGQVDILMVPVGGGDVIEAGRAVKIVEQLEPRLIIPMCYQLPGLNLELADVSDFLKEMGLEKKQPVDKLSIKKKELAAKETEVVVFKP